MTDIPDEAVEAAARALFVMQHRVDVGCFDKQSYKALADACIREARNALTAAAPIIRADVRRRVAEEIRAENPQDEKSYGFDFGVEIGMEKAAQIAERNGE